MYISAKTKTAEFVSFNILNWHRTWHKWIFLIFFTICRSFEMNLISRNTKAAFWFCGVNAIGRYCHITIWPFKEQTLSMCLSTKGTHNKTSTRTFNTTSNPKVTRTSARSTTVGTRSSTRTFCWGAFRTFHTWCSARGTCKWGVKKDFRIWSGLQRHLLAHTLSQMPRKYPYWRCRRTFLFS